MRILYYYSTPYYAFLQWFEEWRFCQVVAGGIFAILLAPVAGQLLPLIAFVAALALRKENLDCNKQDV